ncbi:MAG: hypothetical protein JW940_31775 [Polyangiaceae bacterium]|nr:hypothetical protein [Polyangiaceae bacterium]
MAIPVFLSYPQPHITEQVDFVREVAAYLRTRGLEPRTLGVNEYDTDAPLTAIRRLMLESNGLITIAFRRLWIDQATWKKDANMESVVATPFVESWLTSPWCHIEPAMAFQLGLPILLLRERGVLADGILEKGVVGMYVPEFTADTASGFLHSLEWNELVAKWEGQVRSVREAKGRPPTLFR